MKIKKFKSSPRQLRMFFLTSLLFLQISCTKFSQIDASLLENQLQPSNSTETPSEVPPADPSLTPANHYKPTAPLSWEKSNPTQGPLWSEHAMKVILDEVPQQLLGGSSDVTQFCSRYYQLDNQDRASFWAQLVSAVTKYESGYNPTSRYVETTMGTDPITGSQVASEGLLQLSYQDITGWSFCEFDWNADKKYSLTDPRRSILDPYKNLSCGIKILAQQISRKNIITLGSGAYWAVLKGNGKYQQIAGISAITQSLPFCH